MSEDNWWVYENWAMRPDRARIHYGVCRHCNHGNGHGKRRVRGPVISRISRWHGPFADPVEAMDFANGLSRADTKICFSCLRYVKAARAELKKEIEILNKELRIAKARAHEAYNSEETEFCARSQWAKL